MCMLHQLFSSKDELGIEVLAAHFEHGIRGEESLRDCAFVEDYCKALGIICLSRHADVPAYAAENGIGIEEAARKLRYEFLSSSAEKLGCGLIATAHNADDNAETMLFNLARGTGAKGLQGIPPRRGNIVRPILNMTRDEIERYNIENAVPHVEDSTNSSDDYSRNLIRHSVMPVLRSINPAFSLHALNTAALLRQDEEQLDIMARQVIDSCFDGDSIPIEALNGCTKAVCSRIFRILWPVTLYETHIAALSGLLEGSGLAYADLPGGRVRREQGRLYFTQPSDEKIQTRELIPGQTVELPAAGLRISVNFDVFSKEVNNSFKTYSLKNENICGTLRVSSRADGDKIALLGRNCTKSLKSLFTEAGMTQQQRNMTPVFRDDAGVVAVYGFGIHRRCAAKNGECVLRIDIEKI